MSIVTRIIIFCFVLLFTQIPANASKRVALLIGNNNYSDATKLKNPLNDAQDLAVKLRSLDFEVILGVDLTREKMLAKIREFSRQLRGADTAMIFYAGHALQVNGQNYLAPIDTQLESESDLDFSTISLDRILNAMQTHAKTTLVFLDSCRNNPLARRFIARSRGEKTRGLAKPNSSAEGTYIAFATQPGNVALDGVGRNSPFTTALLNHIDKPNIEIASLMTDVRREVYEATAKQQLPWTNSGLLGRFYFNTAQPTDSTDTSKQNTKQQKNLEQIKIAAKEWELIKTRSDPQVFDEFAKRFPDTPYASLARSNKELLAQKNIIAKQSQRKTTQQKLASLEQEPTKLSNSEPVKDTVAIDQVVLTRAIQTQLNRLGCNAGGADGKWGPKGRSALKRFSKRSKTKLASLDPDAQLLKLLETQKSRVCPLVCSPRQVIKGNHCVLKSCRKNQRLSSTGKCFTPRAKKTVKRPNAGTKTQKARSNNCFVFNGVRVCE